MTYDAHAPTVKEQLYTNQTNPYFRAPHVYLALAARFMQGRTALVGADAAAFTGDEEWRKEDCSDVVLMSARSGETIYRRTFPQALVRPGIGALNWTSRTN